MSDRPVGRAARLWSDPISPARRRCSRPCSSPAAPTNRRGTGKDGNTVGDAHARGARRGRCRPRSTSPRATYLGDPWTFLDCPGSVELAWEAQNALLAADVAVVVCEPEVERALTLGPLFKFLDDHQIPHMVFINKMDTAAARVARRAGGAARRLAAAAGAAPGADARRRGRGHRLCRSRQRARLPIQARARPPTSSSCPTTSGETSARRRAGLVEKLADFDDKLLEQLLEDVAALERGDLPPSRRRICAATSSCRCSSARRSRITACAAC